MKCGKFVDVDENDGDDCDDTLMKGATERKSHTIELELWDRWKKGSVDAEWKYIR